MKNISQNERQRLFTSVSDSLLAIRKAEMPMKHLMDCYTNNKKVHDLLIELEILLKNNGSIDEIDRIVSEISERNVVFEEMFSPHVVAGDLTNEYGLKSTLRAVLIELRLDDSKREAIF